MAQLNLREGHEVDSVSLPTSSGAPPTWVHCKWFKSSRPPRARACGLERRTAGTPLTSKLVGNNHPLHTISAVPHAKARTHADEMVRCSRSANLLRYARDLAANVSPASMAAIKRQVCQGPCKCGRYATAVAACPQKTAMPGVV